jgi:glycosyltransferase involved in cell wall biosynthesis
MSAQSGAGLSDDRRASLALAPKAPPRILMVLYLPATRTLGGARIQVELAEALREKGCTVDFLSGPDVYPSPPRIPHTGLLRSFPRASKSQLKRIASRYDVIDGLEGDVTATKRELGFDGVLVCRTQGLREFYSQWERQARQRWPQHPRGKTLGRVPRSLDHRRLIRNALRSRMNADGFFVANEAEYQVVGASLGTERVRRLPFGLLDAHRAALGQVARERPPGQAPHVAFIGTWDARKGKYDWPAIVRGVWRQLPETRFSFLGTYHGADRVLADLGVGDDGRVSVYPAFEPERLPELLSSATAGAFPSYLEGFGFAVIEQLAAGLPVVAYDVPGPRDILADLDTDLLVAPGDVDEFAARLIETLRRPSVEAARCVDHTERYRWSLIAADTLDAYASWC